MEAKANSYRDRREMDSRAGRNFASAFTIVTFPPGFPKVLVQHSNWPVTLVR